MVQTAQYTSEEGVNYLVRSLMQRREKIGRAFFSEVLPLDNISFREQPAEVRRPGREVRLPCAAHISIRLVAFQQRDRSQNTHQRAPASETLPEELRDGYAVVEIKAEDPQKTVDVYVRRRGARTQIVGIERKW